MAAKSLDALHEFTGSILEVLRNHYGDDAYAIFAASPLLGYLNIKTKSANSGSKARGSFANLYAIYVVIEDYMRHGFHDGSALQAYADYEGARFSALYGRQRELPFGSKLQNHALNSRLNEEFKKFYPTLDMQPLVRDLATQRYWLQEDLVSISIRKKDGKDYSYNIAAAIIDIIDAYAATKRAAFHRFLAACKDISELGKQDPVHATAFIVQQLQPNVDARIFEIVSYAILKAKFGHESIWIGKSRETVTEESLHLYKTGRTNANDGGIDFVMKPLGRFFQVTETTDVKKYFLDIDKVQRFPITFVIKSTDSKDQIISSIQSQAIAKYRIDAVVKSYMMAIEDIINIPDLVSSLKDMIKNNQLQAIMDEIVIQSKVEFNYIDEDDVGSEPG